MNLTRVSAILGVIFVAVSWWIVVTPASDFLPEGTNFAVDIDFLFKFMLVASVAVFLIVEGYILYFVLKYRRRSTDAPNALGKDIHGNTRLEIVWSIIPTVFLVVLTALSYNVYIKMISSHPGEYVIHVTAKQFQWECDHPKYKLQELTACHMPVDTNVRLDLTALDVIHSFWVPEFRVKQDAVPGYPTRMHFEPTRVGTYRLLCSEYCGVGHSYMFTKLYVCPINAALAAKSDTCDHMTFDQWARAQAKQQNSSSGGSLANVSFKNDIQSIFTAHCASCHISIQSGNLSLASYASLIKGSTALPGAVVVPGTHAKSLLWQKVQPTAPWPGGAQMPLGGPYLTAKQVQTIAAWIDQGAKDN